MTNNTTADTTAKGEREGGVIEAVAWIDPRDLNCLSFEDGNLWPGVFRHWTGRHSEPLYSQAAIDTLRAQLEAAEAEVARLRGINSDLCRNHNARLVDAAKSEARTKALEAEAERLRVDAERYRWLRQDAGLAGWHMPRRRVPCPDRIAGCLVAHAGGQLSGATLDAAIDSARTKEAAP